MEEKANQRKPLSTFQASAIICGYGVGGGIMGMPYLVSKVGIFLAIGILLLALLASYFMHLMIADLCLKCGKDSQIIDIFNKFVFKGKAKKVLTIIVFLIIAIVLFANLAVYIAGAAEIISKLFPVLPLWASKMIFYAISACIGLFSLKVLGISEQYAIIIIIGVVLTLCIGSCFNINKGLPTEISSFKDVISFFGVAMFAFVAFFSIPQVVQGLNGEEKKIKHSILYGMLLNLVIMLLVIIFSLLSYKGTIPEKDPIINAWADGIGTWAQIIGSIFIILAMVSTYWSISYALRDILADATKINKRLCFLIATLPALGVAMIPSTAFMDFVNISAGAIAILIGIFVIPVFHIGRKQANGESILGKCGNLTVEIIIALAFIVMAVGNII